MTKHKNNLNLTGRNKDRKKKAEARLLKKNISSEELTVLLDKFCFTEKLMFLMDFGDVQIEYKVYKN